MKPRISMITLGVSNLQESVSFYRDGLKLPVFECTDDVAFFNLNGTWLGLYGKTALAADAGVPADGSGFPGFALAHNLESREEVDRTYQEALEAGASAQKQPQDVFWGGYSGYFKDPDGYLWEVAYNPHFWVGPED